MLKLAISLGVLNVIRASLTLALVTLNLEYAGSRQRAIIYEEQICNATTLELGGFHMPGI